MAAVPNGVLTTQSAPQELNAVDSIAGCVVMFRLYMGAQYGNRQKGNVDRRHEQRR